MTRPTRVAPILIGQQSFDGLTRPSSMKVGGRTRDYDYVAAQLPATRLTLADGKSITYEYVHELGDQLQQVKPADEPADELTYVPELGLVHVREGALGRQTMTYTPSGHPLTNTWRVDGADHVTRWQHSLQGLLLGFEDPSEVDHLREFDAYGRVCHIKTDHSVCVIEYDDLSRPCRYTTTASASGDKLVQSLSYDEAGREATRTFTTTQGGQTSEVMETLTYTDLDQVSTRVWAQGSVSSTQTYRYDALGRLVHYTASPGVAKDSFGNCVVEQSYSVNLLDGYETVQTTFADGSNDLATYHYDNTEDPCQVSAIDHTHPGWPARITLQYDRRGRLERDSLGRVLAWDAHDRVTRVQYQGQTCTYAYDPSGNLCDRTVDGQRARSFYSDEQMTHEQRGEDTLLLMGEADVPFAVSRLAKGVHQGVTLLGCDAQRSVRLEAGEAVTSRHYTAHGAEDLAQFSACNPFGFAGERREPVTGWYIPGGYRPYDPLLMIFLAPDSESPFGGGGINAYSYCGADPVNRSDPDGHSWKNWLIAGISFTIGIVSSVMTFGALTPILVAGFGAMTLSGALAVTTAVVNVAAVVTSFAGAVVKEVHKDSKAGNILGYVSTGLSAVSGILGFRQLILDQLDVGKVVRYANGAHNARIFGNSAPARLVGISPVGSSSRNLASAASSPSLNAHRSASSLNTAVTGRLDSAAVEGIELATRRGSDAISVATDIVPRAASPAVHSGPASRSVSSLSSQASSNIAETSAQASSKVVAQGSSSAAGGLTSRPGILEHVIPPRLFPHTRLLRHFYSRRSL